MSHRSIHQYHCGWDNTLAPVVELEPGDIVELAVMDASGGQITRDSGPEAIAALDFERINPVTGPIWLHGAEPGDVLELEILELQGSGWGWTAIIPGFGLLADEFPQAFLHHSSYGERGVEFLPGIVLPYRPFPGTVGLALAEPGRHSVVPPRRVGGNMDYSELGRGSKLQLPVEVPGALLSIGDTHAAQGHGEVCGTAIESPMRITVRLGLQKQTRIGFPRIRLPPHPPDREDRGHIVTTGIGSDLGRAARDAIREMLEWLGHHRGLSPELAYALCSVAVDLKIGEIVDLPHVLVAAHLPLGIFRD